MRSTGRALSEPERKSKVLTVEMVALREAETLGDKRRKNLHSRKAGSLCHHHHRLSSENSIEGAVSLPAESSFRRQQKTWWENKIP